MAARNRDMRARKPTGTESADQARRGAGHRDVARLGDARRAVHQLLASWALQHLAAQRASEVKHVR
jgi:hypothetical protein